MRPHDLKISWKLQALTVAALLCLAGMAAVSALGLRDRMLADRQTKVQHIVEAVTGTVAYFEAQEKSGALTEAQAQSMAKSALKTMRYGDKGAEYFWIQDAKTGRSINTTRPSSSSANRAARITKSLFSFCSSAATERCWSTPAQAPSTPRPSCKD